MKLGAMLPIINVTTFLKNEMTKLKFIYNR